MSTVFWRPQEVFCLSKTLSAQSRYASLSLIDVWLGLYWISMFVNSHIMVQYMYLDSHDICLWFWLRYPFCRVFNHHYNDTPYIIWRLTKFKSHIILFPRTCRMFCSNCVWNVRSLKTDFIRVVLHSEFVSQILLSCKPIIPFVLIWAHMLNDAELPTKCG